MSVEGAISKITEVLAKFSDQHNNSITNVGSSKDSRGLQLLPFDESSETFECYIERVENYLELRNLDTVNDEKKCVQILINCLGPKLYATLTCLTAPDQPKTKKYSKLVELSKNHLSPRPSEVAEQHKFAVSLQHEGESISNYQAELKRIATKCNFTCEHCKKSTMSTHLRSQFIRGIRDNDIRETLLQKDANTKFEDIVRLPLQIQASKDESRDMKPHDIHRIQANETPPKNQPIHHKGKKQHYKNNSHKKEIKCFRCGKNDHKANACKAKNLKCENCKKPGHVSSVCMKEKKTMHQKAIDVTSESESDNNLFMNMLVSCNKIDTDEYYTTIVIDGKEVSMKLDTGAAVSTISKCTCNKLWPKLKVKPTDIKLKTYTGEVIYVVGVASVKLQYNDYTSYGEIYVLEKNLKPILGREWIRKLHILDTNTNIYKDIRNITEIHCKKEIQELIKRFDELFSEEIGKIPHTSYKAN